MTPRYTNQNDMPKAKAEPAAKGKAEKPKRKLRKKKADSE